MLRIREALLRISDPDPNKFLTQGGWGGQRVETQTAISSLFRSILYWYVSIKGFLYFTAVNRCGEWDVTVVCISKLDIRVSSTVAFVIQTSLKVDDTYGT
jgi:hypothetical protein